MYVCCVYAYLCVCIYPVCCDLTRFDMYACKHACMHVLLGLTLRAKVLLYGKATQSFVICIHEHTCTHIWTYMHAYLNIHTRIFEHTCAHIWTYIHAYLNIHARIFEHTCTHIWTYMHTYLNIYERIFEHTCTHIWTCSGLGCNGLRCVINVILSLSERVLDTLSARYYNDCMSEMTQSLAIFIHKHTCTMQACQVLDSPSRLCTIASVYILEHTYTPHRHVKCSGHARLNFTH